jgi:hypothetical protein
MLLVNLRLKPYAEQSLNNVNVIAQLSLVRAAGERVSALPAAAELLAHRCSFVG